MKNPINNNQMSLFHGAREHGSREWNTFNPIQEDQTGMFRVAAPKPQLPQKPGYFPRFIPRPAR